MTMMMVFPLVRKPSQKCLRMGGRSTCVLVAVESFCFVLFWVNEVFVPLLRGLTECLGSLWLYLTKLYPRDKFREIPGAAEF